MGSLRLAEVHRRVREARDARDGTVRAHCISRTLTADLYRDVLRELLDEADLHPTYRALVEAALAAER